MFRVTQIVWVKSIYCLNWNKSDIHLSPSSFSGCSQQLFVFSINLTNIVFVKFILKFSCFLPEKQFEAQNVTKIFIYLIWNREKLKQKTTMSFYFILFYFILSLGIDIKRLFDYQNKYRLISFFGQLIVSCQTPKLSIFNT